MHLAIFISARSEYGLLRWTIEESLKSDKIFPALFIGGGLTSETYGNSVNEIKEEFSNKVPIFELSYLLDGDTDSHLNKSIGLGIISLSQSFDFWKPDALLVLGDRYDLFVAATSALIRKIPIFHIAGGDLSYGAFDNQIRYAITKLASVHFVQTFKAAENVSRTGEEDNRIFVVGAPGIENIYRLRLPNFKEILDEKGVDLKKPTILCTYHPPSLEFGISVDKQIENFLKALSKFKKLQIILTFPGAETGSNLIIRKLKKFKSENENVFLFDNLGSRLYLGIMKYSIAVVGNSSSGIVEAPSFHVPTVNIGKRQEGRIAADSVLNCGYTTKEIVEAINLVLEKNFRNKLKKIQNPYNPYGDGMVSKRIIKVIENLRINEKLLNKRLDFEVKKNEWNQFI